MIDVDSYTDHHAEMNKTLTILSAGLLAGVVGCTGETSESTSPRPTSAAPSSVPINHCATTPIEHGALPATFTKYIEKMPNWIGDGKAAAILFYADGEDTVIPTRGQGSKILWLVDGKPDGPITLDATNLTTGTRVIQDFEGGGNFPSRPVLPDPGCWQIDAKLGAKTVISVVLVAKEPA